MSTVSESSETLKETEEPSLLMKVQTTGKDWDNAPNELTQLRALLLKTGYEVTWSPKKFAINLLTANKIRGMVLKRILMKAYPFDLFWATETLDETLHKCLIVCQQLGLEVDRPIIWGQCSMDASFRFWCRLLKMVPRISKARKEEDFVHEAKSKVISSLISFRGTDWDRAIARNFEQGLGRNRNHDFLKRCISSNSFLAQNQKPKQKRGVYNRHDYDEGDITDWRSSLKHILDPESDEGKASTTTSLANELKQESQAMIEALRDVEKYYVENSRLEIEDAFKLGYQVCDLAEEFETYMTTNNRGAFRDVDSLTNHTDKVIKSMSKLATVYGDFYAEFRKYFELKWGD
ncbi:hypothetical protein Ocin01_08101 [Orchesella cincta]|uniref:Uncharacterized protein n=1 Tax=Orchesella cincta TaxID=48709 RepID=A0A1D2MZW5_ORCCI|nr:hypothetical protein Ocin01_08101 [Orchesella cincta]